MFATMKSDVQFTAYRIAVLSQAPEKTQQDMCLIEQLQARLRILTMHAERNAKHNAILNQREPDAWGALVA